MSEWGFLLGTFRLVRYMSAFRRVLAGIGHDGEPRSVLQELLLATPSDPDDGGAPPVGPLRHSPPRVGVVKTSLLVGPRWSTGSRARRPRRDRSGSGPS